MHRIPAALAGLAVVVTAGCGTAQATPDRHPTPPPPHCTPATSIITQADSGKTYCARVGDRVTIILKSTEKDLWLRPVDTSNVLEPAPNGIFSLVAGATGAFYRVAGRGRAVVTSIRPPCRAATSGAAPYPVRSCAPGNRFTVTIVAS